jgi:uncharacterized integral membrane protein (TIGR00698 family)
MAELVADFVASITGLFKISVTDVPGVIFALILAEAAKYVASSPYIAPLGEVGKSAQLWAIILGMLYGNFLHDKIEQPKAGLTYCKGKLLKIGIILYGFKVTFQKMYSIGISAIVIDILIMVSTSLLSYYIGTKVLSMETEPSLLAGCGSSICGVSAVMAAGPVVMAKDDQIATTVATMVIFGTFTMFLYPSMRESIPFDDATYGIYTGATLQDMGGVVTAGT